MPERSPADTTSLAPIQAFYDQGLYLQAHAAAQALGPLDTWRGAKGRVLAGRLANALGASRLGGVLHRLAWREHPNDPDALLYAGYTLRSRFGPWAALNLLRQHESLFESATSERRAHLWSLRAFIAAEYREFAQAERFIADAEALAPQDAWVRVERAAVCEAKDDYHAALAAAEEALSLRPGYRPAVTRRAHFLRLLNRDDEAMALLTEAGAKLESAAVLAALLDMQMERELYREAEETLERCAALSPLSDKHDRRWLAARRADVRYHLGDRAGAAAQARAAGGDYFTRLADCLEDPQREDRRVLLDVPFVRQHHMTCAPATLSALARYWHRAAEHLSIAEAICYDGTPNQSSRAWAEDNGWLVREFSLTWDSATALLDRGVPFTLSTVDPGNAHMQAVIGYDNARNCLLIRDPSQRSLVEFGAQALVESYAAYGPQAMAMVPAGEAARLQGIDLPETGLYDDHYAMQSALLRHERAHAAQTVARMAQAAPGHRLTLAAQRALLNYDGDDAGRLRLNDALLEKYPRDVNLRLARQSLLYQLGRRDECLAYLAAQCDGPDSHPLLCMAYAEMLRDDARELPHARHLLRRVLRVMPLKAEVYHKLGHVLWGQDAREAALETYRIAASLETTDERYAESYFRAARHLRKTEEALAFLRGRFERWGNKSAQPAITLFESLDAVDRTAEGLEMLGHALTLRPDDGELMLFCGSAWLRNGDARRARDLLNRARPLARRGSWLQSAAWLEESLGNLDEALAAWEAVASDEPLNLRAVRAVARLRQGTESEQSARDYLRELVDRFPHHHGLNGLYVDWLAGEPPEVIEAALRKLLEINHADAWGWRELALHLARNERLDEAYEALARAHALAPEEADYHSIHARLLSLSGKRDEARAALRESLRRSVDNTYALRELINLCRSDEARHAELAFIHDELMRQVTFGDGLLSYQDIARTVLPPEELLARLRKGPELRPDLWHAWVALAIQLRDMGQADEAGRVLQSAAERFPLLPRVWLEKANVARHCGDAAAREAALIQTLQLSPGWDSPARQLAELYQQQSRNDEARAVIEQALRHNPRDGVLHGWLADSLWLLGQRTEALDHLEQALRLEPGYLWAWDTLGRFAREQGEPQRQLNLALELTGSRPRDARAWLLLARAETGEAALEAVRQALVIDPRSERAHELRIDLLLQAGDRGAALDATQDPVWNGMAPPGLMLRRARVLSDRGERDAAIATLEALVDADHDYPPAWTQLADWYLDAERTQDYLNASRQLLRLEPGDFVSHGYLADALLLTGDRSGGRAALLQALELNPAYDWACNRLFTLELEDRNWEGAARALEFMTAHGNAGAAALARLRLAAARGEQADAATAFEVLAQVAEADDSVFDQAVTVFRDADETRQLNALLDRLIALPGLNPHIGRLWGELRGARLLSQSLIRRLDKLLAQGDLGYRAAAATLRELAKRGNKRSVRRVLGKLGPRLRPDADAWGAAGYALLTLGLNHECARWCSDWRERDDAQPWMLLNLALALRDLGRWAEANAVSRRAQAINPGDSNAQHRVMLAVDAGLAGDSAQLDHWLQTVSEEGMSAYYAYLHALSLALRAVLEGGDPAASYQHARHHIRRGLAVCPTYSREAYLSRAHRLSLWRIAGMRSSLLPLRAWWFIGLL